jgi:hypothetical protein
MKKILLMFSVVLVICFVTTAFAGNPEKTDICHNGSIYTGDITEPAYYSDSWEPASFVINISDKAVAKHVWNHGDSSTDFIYGSEDPIDWLVTEVNINEGKITDISTQQPCEIITSTPLL